MCVCDFLSELLTAVGAGLVQVLGPGQGAFRDAECSDSGKNGGWEGKGHASTMRAENAHVDSGAVHTLNDSGQSAVGVVGVSCDLHQVAGRDGCCSFGAGKLVYELVELLCNFV